MIILNLAKKKNNNSNKMKLIYYINSKKFNTNKTNNDLELIAHQENNRFTLKIKALKDLTLGIRYSKKRY